MVSALRQSTRLLCLMLTVFCMEAATARTFRVAQSNHPLDGYAIGALKVALEHMDEQHNLNVATRNVTQQRVFEDLNSEQVDIYWAATRRDLEENFSPVRFPILKGLLGHRVMIIHPSAQVKFDSVRTLDDLKKLTLGQGLGWPDVGVLRTNGLQVITTSKYNNLFYMTDGQRFDGFPRGVLEPWAEIAAHPNLELAVEKRVVLVYTLPFYFFVNKKDPALAQALHEAFDRSIASGAFDRYFYGHPLIKDALEKSDLKHRLRFPLAAPDLPSNIPLDRPEYWLNLQDL